MGMIIVASSTLGIISDVIVIMTFYRFRATPVIKSANILHSTFQHCCHLMLFLVTPVLFVGEPILILCQIRHVVVGLFLTIICSVIFLKTQKLLFIFRCKLRVSQREKQVSTVTDLFYLLLFLSAQTITATLTLSQTPAKVVNSINKKSMIRKVYCNTGGHLNLQSLSC